MSSLYLELVGFIETKEWKTDPFPISREGGGSCKVTLCHLLSSWWPLTPSSKALNAHHLAGFVLLLPSPTNSQKGIPLYITPFGMSLDQKSLLDDTWPRSLFPISSTSPAVGASTPKSQKSSPHCVKGFADGLTSFLNMNMIMLQSYTLSPKSALSLI